MPLRPLLLAAFAPLSAIAFGQPTPPDAPIQTSRPSFSDTPQIVPLGHLQLESGVTAYARGDGSPSRSDFGEALLRYGVRRNVELRLQLPSYNIGGGGSADGFDNTSVAASFYLGKFLGFDLGIIPTVSFPTGARALRDEIVTPSFLFNAQRDLGSGSSIGGTFAQSYGKQSGHDLTSTTGTVVYVRPLGGALTGFVEYAGFFDPLDRPQQYAHVGVQFLVTKISQIDVHGGAGRGGSEARSFVGAGYSVRF